MNFENSMDALFITAPDGRVEDANLAACDMFGYMREALVQLGRDAIVDPDDDRLHDAFKERASTGKFRGELFLKRKDGSKFPVEYLRLYSKTATAMKEQAWSSVT